MRRIDPLIEHRVVTLIALGYAYKDIHAKTGVAVPTIKKIKKRTRERLEKVEEQVVERHVDEVSATLHKTYRQINALLDKCHSGSLDITIKDLLTISKEMHRQSIVNSPPLTRHKRLETVYKKYL